MLINSCTLSNLIYPIGIFADFLLFFFRLDISFGVNDFGSCFVGLVNFFCIGKKRENEKKVQFFNRSKIFL